MLVMYAGWALALLAVAGYGLAGSVAQLAAFGLVAGIGIAFAQGTWGTMMHRLVPREVLGRVTSLDWLVSTSLMPMWFVLIGFVADGVGVRATLVAAGLIGGVTTMLFPFVFRGIREPEHDSAARGEPLKAPARLSRLPTRGRNPCPNPSTKIEQPPKAGLDDAERAALQADRDHDREQDEADNDIPSGPDPALPED